ncbi:VOC family protein [Kribbella sp. NPDC049227]|uniref:VOC family protein n=1 Tax=Kribbella sp. NPDC049227 TaxID=3364113 RepID=UPI003719A2F3
MNEKIPLMGVVLDAPDAQELARWYCRLLGWELGDDEDGWATAIGPQGVTKLSFQGEPTYRPPTWPSSPEQQQMQLHLDFKVDDLETAHRRAIDAGARLMEFQPQPNVRVYADPVGHIFCFFV